MSLSEREKELLIAVAEATVGTGGYLSVYGSLNIVEWSCGPDHDQNGTPRPAETTEAALTEAAERLGVLPPERRFIEDGFGSQWALCDRPDCGLQVVRPGKVQCFCDDDGSVAP